MDKGGSVPATGIAEQGGGKDLVEIFRVGIDHSEHARVPKNNELFTAYEDPPIAVFFSAPL